MLLAGRCVRLYASHSMAEAIMRFGKLLAVAIIFCVSNAAMANIRTFMNAHPKIVEVQIYQGLADCGSPNNKKNYDNAMTAGYSQSWPNTGMQGDNICWRRTDPPDEGESFTPWHKCITDGDCEIK